MASLPNLHDNQNLTTTTDALPEHHVHKASEPLPGARGGAPAADYTTETMERLPSSVWQESDPSQPTRELADASDLPPNSQSTRPDLPERNNSATGRTALIGERPMNTETQPGGGVSIDGGHESTPTGKASGADKVIGKAQQIIGKVTKKPELQEKGELRQSVGKSV
ncbi:hypothetical protein K438DRAFT_1983505 [Mycena galopus ATCC 62051]|nr:hypothetical protein K438DRAFT_1983505 [Mycena galopus ATCC 62051]